MMAAQHVNADCCVVAQGPSGSSTLGAETPCPRLLQAGELSGLFSSFNNRTAEIQEALTKVIHKIQCHYLQLLI